ncbi:hypothetical protein PHLCEN_2v9529 [Hermanssonia centrifuga]|uniref:Uncharacterized protein n=1 Tax=Hermanssonia centrifuga TaxID=98765 RepID=A0A2R6NR99_9APHY|nr:hypothetical protein PHLCEN_2v9529 [Hermanssonia centrifuga]
MVEYLKNGTLLTLPEVGDVLGTVNAVTMGNYEQPIKISVFVKDLFAGFAMLNLKNDTLRRRYDSLKYDIKKIEEGIVYDVSLRNLAPASSNTEQKA